MKENDILEKSKTLAEKGEWPSVYKLLSDYFGNITKPSLNRDEKAILLLLKLKAVINCVNLVEFSTFDLEPEKHAQIKHLIVGSVNDLHLYLKSEREISKRKNIINNFFEESCLAVQENFYSWFNTHLSQISDEYTGSSPNIKILFDIKIGYMLLNQLVVEEFLRNANSLSVELDLELNPLKKAIKEVEQITFDKATSLALDVSAMTEDFPYFNGGNDFEISKHVMYKYGFAINLIGFSLSSKSLLPDIKTRVYRLKYEVNVICDFLNAITVAQGQRVSTLPSSNGRNTIYNNMLNAVKEIRETEPTYQHPPVNKEVFSTLPEKSKSGGCYVATAVYGSYDCSEVWTLRRYRDCTLAKTWYGRAFIKTYYVISPTLVKWFGHTEWFKRMWQGKLDRMVAKLQANGVESTPYEDKNW